MKAVLVPRRESSRILRRAPKGLLLLALALAPARHLLAEEATLYEKIALGTLVVHAKCGIVGRRASVSILERFKGSYAEPKLWVSYRSENYNRTPGSAKIEFNPEAESILVLDHETDDEGNVKSPDRFVLVGGAKGKIDIPQEGAEALLNAVRRLAAIQALKDQEAVWGAQRELLRETNPLLIRAGFEEVLRFRLGDESIVAPMLGHLTGPRPEFRIMALAVISQMLAADKRRGRATPSSDLLVREALARASGDESAEIRAAAVRALRSIRRPDLAEAMAQLAAKDPSQLVRYEAELNLMELRTSPEPGAEPGAH